MTARILLLVAVLLAAGCSTPVGVDRVEPQKLRRELTANILTGSTPSAPSRQLLDRLALVQAFKDSPAEALETIRQGLGGPDTAKRLLGLAELSFAHGDATRDRIWYRASALAAYAYLFPENGHAGPNPFDPGLRLAAELYNRGVALGFPGEGDADLSAVPERWELPYGEIALEVDPAHLGWSGYRMHEVVPSAELRVRGLRNRYRRVGIGAPLAATVERIEGEASGYRVGPSMRIPITAVIRFEEPWKAVITGEVVAALEIYVMDSSKEVQIGDRRVPLEYEPTTALAFGLENPAVWSMEFGGFFSGDLSAFEDKRKNGLVLLHPYRPGRVPVVLVHGTASSPARWAELVNELAGDPAIAERIQLWLFFYNTGNPILYSGSLLRQALRDTVAELDPEGTDPAMQRMFVMGHSQGGLLSKLQVVNSGYVFWEGVSDRDFSELDLSDETRELFSRAMFIDALPFVRRVVYVSTPHGGSYQARRRIAGWIGSFISLPLDFSRRMTEMLTNNEDLQMRLRLDRMPTSLDNMTPGNPFLVALSSLDEAPGVTTHSIISAKGDGPLERRTDGVVAYESAHVEGVKSELVVRSGHSVQGDPNMIAEVKRILYEHFDQLEAEIAKAAN
ncbi:MAG: alpha/beta fold hydrolase [Deltaproteobacteria bacterium]|nr:alpha/beta fold hydrolase [Deltaproteobacteria bacterium]